MERTRSLQVGTDHPPQADQSSLQTCNPAAPAHGSVPCAGRQGRRALPRQDAGQRDALAPAALDLRSPHEQAVYARDHPAQARGPGRVRGPSTTTTQPTGTSASRRGAPRTRTATGSRTRASPRATTCHPPEVPPRRSWRIWRGPGAIAADHPREALRRRRPEAPSPRVSRISPSISSTRSASVNGPASIKRWNGSMPMRGIGLQGVDTCHPNACRTGPWPRERNRRSACQGQGWTGLRSGDRPGRRSSGSRASRRGPIACRARRSPGVEPGPWSRARRS